MTEDRTTLTAVVRASTEVAATRSRTEKTRRLAELVAALSPDEAIPTTGLLLGRPSRGRLGIGWRTASTACTEPAAASSLTVFDVDAAFRALADARGPGSAAVRSAVLGDLMRRATAEEQDYLVRVLIGEMRTGALEGVLTEAVATATGVTPAVLRRAAMLSGDLGATVRAALIGEDLAAAGLTPGVPVSPMLAASAATIAEAVDAVGAASVETKLDGARIQAHRVGGVVRVFTRTLADITERVPEIVDIVTGFPGGDLVLDGEALAFDGEGVARPFQETMSRFGSESGREQIVLAPRFFDVLHADGTNLIDESLRLRREVLAGIVGDWIIRGVLVDPGGVARADAFFAEAVDAGNEGVVVKELASTYMAGRRGSNWIKVKPVHTYDLVVLAVEHGSGRRTGKLSNLHLGARDPDGRYGEPGGFVMVGKTFKGLTDALLTWQTEYFPQIAVAQERQVLRVRPETVVEIAIDGVQRSSRYPGGVAVRFARVRRYRVGADAKRAADADTIDSLRALLRA